VNDSQPPPEYPGVPPPIDSAANAALILGILSLVCLGPLAGIPAIICGHLARGRIARSGGSVGGSGQALAGLVMGYVSLLLLVAFFGILARSLSKVQAAAAKPAVTAKQSQLAAALTAYKADFGEYPKLSPSSGEEVDIKALMAILEGKNARNQKYYAGGGSGIEFNGIPADPWAQLLHIAIDLNGDGSVQVGDQQLPGPCAVWSSGRNKVNEHGTGDDVASW